MRETDTCECALDVPLVCFVFDIQNKKVCQVWLMVEPSTLVLCVSNNSKLKSVPCLYVVYYFIERQQKVCCVAGSEEINSDEDLLAVLSGGKKRIEPIKDKEEATSLDDPIEPESKDAKDTKPETNKEAAKPSKGIESILLCSRNLLFH